MPYETLRSLIQAFLDGNTTPAEEKSIYSAYGTSAPGSLHADLERYRAMFEWYLTLAGSETTQAQAKPARKSRHWLRYAAAAAVTAAVTLAATFIADPFHSDRDSVLYARYAGSYVIKDGKRVSDLDAILVTVMRAEHIADSLRNYSMELENIPDMDDDRTIIKNALSDVNDPALARQLYNDLLNEQEGV